MWRRGHLNRIKELLQIGARDAGGQITPVPTWKHYRGIDAPVIALGEALDEARIPRERFAALKPGQILEI